MKKLFVFLIAAVMMFTISGIVMAGETARSEDISKDFMNCLWELSDDMDDEEFMKLASRNFKFIQSIEPIVDVNSYKTLYKASVHLKQKAEGAREEFIEAQNNLVLLSSIEEGVIFLWDKDNIPSDPADAELTDEQLDAAPLDGVGFVPLLVKCLLDDPAQAKGNVIVISGGAMMNRSNSAEAYPAIPVFQDLGYNVFVLQYRIAPYSQEDAYMDTQRAIRMVRYYAQMEGWGGQDMIAAAGWSAGGGCITGAINEYYGMLTPADVNSPDYIPDEIDQLSSDLDTAMIIYCSGVDPDSGNPLIPPIYSCVGTEDTAESIYDGLSIYDSVLNMYEDLSAHGVPIFLHVIEGAGHGFGVGQEGATKSVPECAEWPDEADEFMQANLGYSGQGD